MQIEKLAFTGDVEQVKRDLDAVLQMTGWGNYNQISLTHRPGAIDPWTDGLGSLYDKVNKVDIAHEADFTEYNALLPEYTKTLLQYVSKQMNFELGRVRFMKQESKRGLSVHSDTSRRYHLVLQTNPNAFFGFTTARTGITALCYHLPCDGNFYSVDTTKEHFVYNGGWEERIHLVICPR